MNLPYILDMNSRYFLIISIVCLHVLVFAIGLAVAEDCKPTSPDMIGPFYKPGAPVRPKVGKGYLLSGVVKSSKDCSPVNGAKIEFWLVNPDGEYSDSHRATVYSDKSGAYQFESNYPKPYFGRPPHIHIRISAQGFITLVTQHYPEKGNTSAGFDLVLIPVE